MNSLEIADNGFDGLEMIAQISLRSFFRHVLQLISNQIDPILDSRDRDNRDIRDRDVVILTKRFSCLGNISEQLNPSGDVGYHKLRLFNEKTKKNEKLIMSNFLLDIKNESENSYSRFSFEVQVQKIRWDVAIRSNRKRSIMIRD